MEVQVNLVAPNPHETVLWYEFLLHQELLLKHLSKPLADPTPIELITKFYEVISETIRNKSESENGELSNGDANVEVKHPAKNIALKILSIKVAAFLKWGLASIRSLPLKTQLNLLKDLMYFTNQNCHIEIPKVDVKDLVNISKQFLFGLVLYHRWLLNTTMHRITSIWQFRFCINDITPSDENIICSPENVEDTIKFLTDSLLWENIPHLLTFDCFNLPTEKNDNIEFDWLQAHIISHTEFRAQINYDLGAFFFYKENYALAKQHFTQCLENYNKIVQSVGFVDFDEETLHVYVKACSGTVDIQKGNLLEQLNHSVFNQYTGIINILQQDNIYKEIPLMHRLNLELDIQGALSSGVFTVARDLVYKIKALNVIRSVLDKKPLYQCSSFCTKQIDTLLWLIQDSWKQLSSEDKSTMKTFLLELIIKDEIVDLLNKVQGNPVLSSCFEASELEYVKNTKVHLEIPDSLRRNNINTLDLTKKQKPKIELQHLEEQLISTYDHKEIREIILKITKSNAGTRISKMNPQWELPIPLQSVLKSLPRGFLQDYAYVILAKSKEQMLSNNWNSSLELLIILDKELQSGNGNVSKLFKLVSWEILLVQITQLLAEWSKNSIDKQALANACEACLQSSDSVLPRTEITEQCIVCLLNLRRWEFLINLDRRWSTFELSAAIATTCHELVNNKTPKKLSKNLWELVLSVFFIPPSQSKRSNSGQNYHDVTNMKMNVMAVFLKLRDPMTLGVVISLLTKLFNILKDEASLELQVDYLNLWPVVVSNANSYNSVAVCEILSEMVLQAVKLNPLNVAWLRLLGDINFANGYYQASLCYYLKSLLIINDYFNIPVRNDDHVFRRMIKCCTSLGCNTQAAVLCQFLGEPDYSLAFRILSDQKTCNDAVDAYYHCFWDTNILEYLIYVHNKKGEFQRRKCAVQVMGLLELNSSNNEEIQREASNLRKSTFLRALCKQYVF